MFITTLINKVDNSRTTRNIWLAVRNTTGNFVLKLGMAIMGLTYMGQLLLNDLKKRTEAAGVVYAAQLEAEEDEEPP